MNILIIGGGGREHALATKINQSDLCDKVFVAPGNPGIAEEAECINIAVDDMDGILNVVKDKDIKTVVIGPEVPLVKGLANYIQSNMPQVLVIGPKAKGAMLEGSKAFAKSFMMRHHIPTAKYLEVTEDNLHDGLLHLESLKPPFVLKANGLAAGKGVLILDDLNEAKSELKAMIEGKFGEASSSVVIEEFLDGLEFSVFALTDGKDYILLPEAKDYKRIGEGDTGLNTGGMGAVSPVPFVDKKMMDKVISRIVKPTIKGFEDDGIEYVGFVFFGLIEVKGEPMVIEYNCRMGDPETEVVLPRLKSDLVEAFEKIREGKLRSYEVEIEDKSAATVILVSGGYPQAYEKGIKINNLDKVDGSIVYHSGTKSDNGNIVTNGGRVLAITSLDDDFRKAVEKSKSNAEIIDWEGKYYRTDIGFDL